MCKAPGTQALRRCVTMQRHCRARCARGRPRVALLLAALLLLLVGAAGRAAAQQPATAAAAAVADATTGVNDSAAANATAAPIVLVNATAAEADNTTAAATAGNMTATANAITSAVVRTAAGADASPNVLAPTLPAPADAGAAPAGAPGSTTGTSSSAAQAAAAGPAEGPAAAAAPAINIEAPAAEASEAIPDLSRVGLQLQPWAAAEAEAAAAAPAAAPIVSVPPGTAAQFGAAAAAALGTAGLAAVARRYGTTAADLRRRLASDGDLGVTKGGALLYSCRGPSHASGAHSHGPAAGGTGPGEGAGLDPLTAAAAAGGPVTAATLPSADPDPPFSQFDRLHSRPSSPNKVHLDFDGCVVTGTLWNNDTGRPRIEVPAYTEDLSPGFTEDEKRSVVAIWRCVAEDYGRFISNV